MSQKQWGHGFHTGRKSRANKGYTGLWFHSFQPDGRVRWQGVILRRVEKDKWLVRLHSWWDGSANGTELVDREQMRTFKFYETDFAMRRAWQNYQSNHRDLYPDAPTEEDFEWQELLIGKR